MHQKIEALIGNPETVEVEFKPKKSVNVKSIQVELEVEGDELRRAIVHNQQRRGTVKGHGKAVVETGALRLRREDDEVDDGQNADAFFGRLTTADGTEEAVDAEADLDVFYTIDGQERTPLDYPRVKTIDLPPESARLQLHFAFKSEASSVVKCRFAYTFTQTYEKKDLLSGDASESDTFAQEHLTNFKFESIAPMQVTWSLIRPDEAFLKVFES